jgi:hypothetical protein
VIVHHDGRIRAEPVLWLGGQDFDLEIHNGKPDDDIRGVRSG